MRRTNIKQRPRRPCHQITQERLIDGADPAVGQKGSKGRSRGSRHKGKNKCLPVAKSTAQQKDIGDDAFGKFVQHHTECRHNARENADRKRDGVHHAVNERVKPDPKHGNKADCIVFSRWFIAHLCCQKPVQKVHHEVAGQHEDRAFATQLKAFWHQMQERDRDQDACGETGKIDGISAAPIAEAPYSQDPNGCDETGKQACPQGKGDDR